MKTELSLLCVSNTLAARMPCQTKSMLASGNGNLFQSKSDALLPEMRQSAKESFELITIFIYIKYSCFYLG
jgi:hypothetical protein